MIYSYSIEKSSICIKKDIAKQTGFTKLTMRCLRLNVRECLQVLQCLFEVCKKCVRKDALNYVETLYT